MNALYFLILLIIVGLNIINPNNVYFSLLITALGVPLLSLAAMVYSRFNIIITAVDVPKYAIKNRRISVTVSVKNRGILPVIYNEVKINCKLYEKCIEFSSESRVEVAVKPGETKQIVLKTAIPNYALTEICVESIKLRDYMGLFRSTIRIIKRKAVKQDNHAIKQIPVIPYVNGAFENSMDETSTVEPGTADGFSTQALFAYSNSGEFEGIREYRTGDTRNRIHQKLSAKSDITFVKEYNDSEYPPILLILEPNAVKQGERLDEMLDEFTKTACELINKNIPFYALTYGYDYEGRLVGDLESLKELLINMIESVSLRKYNEYISDGIPQQFSIIYTFPETEKLKAEEL
jgi:hypothetical protein